MKRKVGVGGVLITACLWLSGCGNPIGVAEVPGWRGIGNDVLKRCDGTTLVYAMHHNGSGRALAIVPNAKECAS